jgi:pantetheine-phosphate adenylyltransferase
MIRAVFPGTFDPIHFGHIDIAVRAARLFDELIVAVYDRPVKTLLFSPEERLALVRKTFINHSNIKVMGYNSLTVEFCRKTDSQVIVRGLRVFSDYEQEFKIGLANHRLAPEIESVMLITNEEHTFLSSSTVKEISSLGGDVSSMVSKFVENALRDKFKEIGSVQQFANASLRD